MIKRVVHEVALTFVEQKAGEGRHIQVIRVGPEKMIRQELLTLPGGRGDLVRCAV